MISSLSWFLLVSSSHLVLYFILFLMLLVIIVGIFLCYSCISFFSLFFPFLDSLVVWPITFLIVSYVIPGFDPFVCFSCYDPSFSVLHIRGQQWFWSYHSSFSWIDSVLCRNLSDGSYLTFSQFPCFLSVCFPVLVVGDSSDVIHSWGVSDLGIKMDVIPGHVTLDLIYPLISGLFSGFCYEICGSYHSLMTICLVIT
uniref:cytochrome-c oxidase n=1 Tax=Kudoa iwatai TaxID=269814 RepID=A0A0H5AY30_9CNID|nr:cytochrome c oxidase subunit II [Kudoa iwatai]